MFLGWMGVVKKLLEWNRGCIRIACGGLMELTEAELGVGSWALRLECCSTWSSGCMAKIQVAGAIS